MRLPGSLQSRLALAIGAVVALLWIGAALAAAAVLRQEMNEVFDSALQETAERILPLAVLEILDREEEDVSRSIAGAPPQGEHYTYVVRDELGTVLLRSNRAEDQAFPAFVSTGFRQTATHRIYYDAALRGTVTIAVAEPLQHRADAAREALLALAMPLLILVPLSLAGIVLVVRRALRPVRRFSAEVATRGAGDLSPVRDGSMPDELAPMAEAVNRLLERLRRALSAEREFTANAAHELRTPVAAALAQTQRLMAETDDAAAGRRAAEIECSLKRLNALAEKLMQLARAEGGRMRTEQARDMRPLLHMLVGDFARGADRDRIALDMPEGPVLSDMDADAFAILGRNLLENALKHSPSGSPVQVTLSAAGVLRVVNEGAPVPRDRLDALTRRFERGRTTASGSGLGLSIARAIAEGAQAALEIRSPATGSEAGFEAVLHLPR